jgi:predicted DNA-binding transcriptional regulator AlpA
MLTLAEVCAELRITRSTFNDWRAKKCAPSCVRLPNRQLRFRRSELDDWIASREAAAA